MAERVNKVEGTTKASFRIQNLTRLSAFEGLSFNVEIRIAIRVLGSKSDRNQIEIAERNSTITVIVSRIAWQRDFPFEKEKGNGMPLAANASRAMQCNAI